MQSTAKGGEAESERKETEREGNEETVEGGNWEYELEGFLRRPKGVGC